METLLGALTHALVSDGVEADPVEPLELKGKAERVPAFRLVALVSRDRTSSSPLVGRDDDLELLRVQVGAADAVGTGRLVTVVGEAGVGKSRLLREFTAGLGGSARVVHGRCLPYGEGITFWPLAEAVRSAAAIAEDDHVDAARAKVFALAGEDVDVSDRVASAIGLIPAVYAVEETFWGVRRLFEILAADRPLVVVIEDLHWAEPTLLELVDNVVERVGRPCVVVCTARPELLDRPDAPAEGDGRLRIALDRLGAGDASAMADRLLAGRPVDAATFDRIVAASDGNPLFMEQMAAMLDDADPAADFAVPPTILALLAARLDRLAQPERAVLEPASVAGLAFPSAAVVELTDESMRAGVPDRLVAVERRRFIRSHPAIMGDDNTYEFEHILVRDAVYRRLLKRTRSQLHERFAAWADRVNGDRAAEFAEITAYHLEQAYRYLAELGPLDDHGLALGKRAGERLAGAGQRAFARGDMHAAAALLGRAADLMLEYDPERLGLLPDLGEALMDLGEFAQAEAVLAAAIVDANAVGDHRLAAEISLGRLLVQLYGEEGAWGKRALGEAERARRVFELEGDNHGLAKAWRIISSVHATALRYDLAADAVQRAIECARLAGDLRQERRNAGAFTMACVYGPMPVAAAIEHCREVRRIAGGDRRTEGLALCALSQLEAMRGNFAEARKLYTTARTVLTDIGGGVLGASTALDSSTVELLAGDPVAAERDLVRDTELLERMGERYLLSTMAALLAQALIAQGRYDEAEAACDRAEAAAAADDIESQVLVRSVRALLHLNAGRIDEAAATITAATHLLRGVEAPTIVADAAVVSARVAAAQGDLEAADRELAAAAALYRQKGSVVSEARVTDLRAALGLQPVDA
jgi:tetratricopeptide (TPR) repeat protein